MSTQIYVNLPVKDLDKSKDFFSKLGFKFNPQFTDNNAACMIISNDIFAMLLDDKFFKTFTTKQISDTAKSTEVILAITAQSREKVDEMIATAAKAGGREPRPPQDHGWMYGRRFEEIDGHLWEVFHMDPNGPPKT